MADAIYRQCADARGAPDVDRRGRLTHREFLADYLRPLKPVIVTGAIDGWPATTRWTLDFFASRYGSRTVAIDGRSLRFSDFIDLVERSTPTRPAPYFRNILIEDWAPELMADIDPLPPYTRPNWLDSPFFPERRSLTSIELYIGGAGARFPVLHYDNLHTHAFLMQLSGAKEYVFYPPEAAAYLYPRAGSETNKSAIDDIERPDLERFPLFTRATAARCRLEAGEMLFVPSGWWHTARIVTPSITVSANTANASNWPSFTRDYTASVARHRSVWRAQAVGAYLALFAACDRAVSMWT